MTTKDYMIFSLIVLRTQRGAKHYGEKPNDDSFLNMLLCDYVCLTNLSAFFRLNEEGTRQEIAQILARFSLLMLRSKSPHSTDS